MGWITDYFCDLSFAMRTHQTVLIIVPFAIALVAINDGSWASSVEIVGAMVFHSGVSNTLIKSQRRQAYTQG